MSTLIARPQPKRVTDLVRQRSEIGTAADKGNIGVALNIATAKAVAVQAWEVCSASERQFRRRCDVLDVVDIERVWRVPRTSADPTD